MRVFIEPSISHLPETKLLFNHTEGMLDPGRDSGLLAILLKVAVSQGLLFHGD